MDISCLPPPISAARKGISWFGLLVWLLVLCSILMIVIPECLGRDPRSKEERTRDEIKRTLLIVRDRIGTYQSLNKGNLPATSSVWAALLDGNYNLAWACPTISVNPANGQTSVATAPSPNVGWVYLVSGRNFTFKAVDTVGTGVLSY